MTGVVDGDGHFRQYNAPMLDNAALSRWQVIRDTAAADSVWMEGHQRLVARRTVVQSEILELIREFLDRRIDGETLRSTFDTWTRIDWTGFGLKGMSFSMFLNKLLKYLGDQPDLDDRLRATLALPASPLLASYELVDETQTNTD